MICVARSAVDLATAWRVRDALARHPLLAGSVTRIQINASRENISLEGWVLDEQLQQLAQQIALREAGCRPVLIRLVTGVNSVPDQPVPVQQAPPHPIPDWTDGLPLSASL